MSGGGEGVWRKHGPRGSEGLQKGVRQWLRGSATDNTLSWAARAVAHLSTYRAALVTRHPTPNTLPLAPPLKKQSLLLRLPAPENVATGLMAAQKSGPVSVAVIGYITSDVSQQGLLAIPAVLGQLVQV